MGKENEDIKNELAKFAGKYAPAAIISAVVKSVNENDTIVVVTGSGLEIDDARLKSVVKDGNKFILLPKIQSTVLIGRIEESEEWTVLQVEEIDRLYLEIDATSIDVSADGIVFNRGDLGGLVKLNSIVQRLNFLEQDLNTLKNAFSNWVVVPSDGGAALKAAATLWAGNQLEVTVNIDLENDKIKQ